MCMMVRQSSPSPSRRWTVCHVWSGSPAGNWFAKIWCLARCRLGVDGLAIGGRVFIAAERVCVFRMLRLDQEHALVEPGPGGSDLAERCAHAGLRPCAEPFEGGSEHGARRRAGPLKVNWAV